MNANAIRSINGKDIPCVYSDFDWRGMKMQLSPLCENDFLDVKKDFTCGYHEIDTMPLLLFVWHGKLYHTKSACSSWSTNAWKVHLNIYKLQCIDGLNCGDRILFYIPYYPKANWEEFTEWRDELGHVGHIQRDLTHFEAQGRKWTIRRAFLDSSHNFPKPYDLLPSSSIDSDLCGCFLETQAQDGDVYQELSAMAESLCRLEGLSIGRFIMWQTAWIARGDECFLYNSSNISTSDNNFTGTRAVKDVADFSPARIIPSTIDNYLTDKDTWASTLYWFLASMYNASLVRVSLHLQFPLLERLVDSAFLALSEGFTGQNFTSKDFQKTLQDSRKAVLAGLNNTSVPAEVSATGELLKLWAENIDKGPHYKEKISHLFKYAGHTLNKKELKELNERNTLAHSVYIHTSDCMEAHHLFISITQKTYMLILAMLGYGGYFEVMGVF